MYHKIRSYEPPRRVWLITCGGWSAMYAYVWYVDWRSLNHLRIYVRTNVQGRGGRARPTYVNKFSGTCLMILISLAGILEILPVTLHRALKKRLKLFETSLCSTKPRVSWSLVRCFALNNLNFEKQAALWRKIGLLLCTFCSVLLSAVPARW